MPCPVISTPDACASPTTRSSLLPLALRSTASRYRSSWSDAISHMPAPAARPSALSCTYPPSTVAAMFVLYGDLSLLKRTSRYGRKMHRSEEHTSELQSLTNLVCRLLLEKKKD